MCGIMFTAKEVRFYDLSGVFIIDKNVEIHTVHTIVSWPNPK